jgi:hypothetical protein
LAGCLGRNDHITEPIIEAANRVVTAAYHTTYSWWVASAVGNAAYLAAGAASPEDNPGLWEGPLADSEAANLLFRTATLRTICLVTRIRRDFDRLVYLAKTHAGTDDTPVPPDAFGPMWPEGRTPDWAKEPPAPGAS